MKPLPSSASALVALTVALCATGCTGGGMRIPVGSSYAGGDITYGVHANLGYGRGSTRPETSGSEASGSGLMGEMFLDLNIVPEQHGIGFRGGYQWHAFDDEQTGGTRYTGFHGMVYYLFRPVSRLTLFAGMGAVFSGTLRTAAVVTTPRGVSRLAQETDSGAFRAQLGLRLLAIKFSEYITWSPYVEASWTATGETDIGSFSGGGVTFGALFTANVRSRGRGY